MENCKTGRIYKIVSSQTDKCYVGTTTRFLSVLLCYYRVNYRLYTEGKRSYNSSMEILKYNDAKIVLLEKLKFNNKEDLAKRQRHYMDNLNCVNKNIPSRTEEEYRNSDGYKNLLREHKKKRLAIKINCQCGGKTSQANLSDHNKTKRHQKYLQNHKQEQGPTLQELEEEFKTLFC